MDRASGHWTYTVALAPGVYNYAFVNEQGEWFRAEERAGPKG